MYGCYFGLLRLFIRISLSAGYNLRCEEGILLCCIVFPSNRLASEPLKLVAITRMIESDVQCNVNQPQLLFQKSWNDNFFKKITVHT